MAGNITSHPTAAPVSTLMQRQVPRVRAGQSVERVEDFMSRNGMAWVPVLGDKGTVVGAVSAADLLRFHAAGRDGAATPVEQLCAYKPLLVDRDTPIREVAALMVDNRVHHAIVSGEGRFEGVASALDFVRAFVSGPVGLPRPG
jgi:CBS domain-containing protein